MFKLFRLLLRARNISLFGLWSSCAFSMESRYMIWYFWSPNINIIFISEEWLSKLSVLIVSEGRGELILYVASSVPEIYNRDCRVTDKLVALGAQLLSPLPQSMLCFTRIQSYSYTDQRKVENRYWSNETGITHQTGDLRLRRPHINRLTYICV